MLGAQGAGPEREPKSGDVPEALVHDASKGILYTMSCVGDVSEARYKKNQVRSKASPGGITSMDD